MRPKIDISAEIAEWGDSENARQTVKIINRSKRSAVNLKFELLIVTLKNVPDGILRSTKSIDLKKDSAFILHGFSKNDRDAKFARRISVSENLQDLWNNDDQQFLVFRVYAYDEVSGFAKLKEVEYRTKRNSIVKGVFHSGNSFKVG